MEWIPRHLAGACSGDSPLLGQISRQFIGIRHDLLPEIVELILMDMDMPNMDGLTATRYLRMKEVKSKIYALTGNTDAKSIEECLDAGCDGHLEKPFDLEKLNSVIESLRPSTS